ncbi:hypothetical protein [Aphanothece sacrum]|uniref:Uncharacterized protein n=1 Tax=Aphanothece sacrum FPU1 TaxID=1920663 RepID=A0A401IHA8_APHSA|nr:hypothetical protein [Aphanothece sacrum]GBF80685.1 hypothetical protein AsFPU1_2089 [Aphanothece sacrum FPU1]GBF83179.1 hypothetical protein AsFPU3_0218 [Aphanothece sacrum FPU3]
MVTVTTAKFSVKDYHKIVESGILHNHQVELINGLISYSWAILACKTLSSL